LLRTNGHEDFITDITDITDTYGYQEADDDDEGNSDGNQQNFHEGVPSVHTRHRIIKLLGHLQRARPSSSLIT
jgi:hypothetical protein